MIILVTGGTGLVGKALQKETTNDPDNFWVFLSSQDCNLCKYDEIDTSFMKIKPDYVIHLAARVGGLFRNMKEPADMFMDNMQMNMNIFKCCRKYNVKKLVSCLSTCIFPDNIKYPIDETKLHNGPPHPSNEAYAYAKRMVDILNKSYSKQHGCKYVSVIPTNIFGEHDNFNLQDSHVIPALIHKCYMAMQHNSDFVVFGSGKPLRQFIYSCDLAKLIKWVVLNYEETEPIILSPDKKEEISIRTVAKIIGEQMGFKGKIKFDTTKADGQYKKTASNAKLRKYLPQFRFTSIDQALQNTIQWFVNAYPDVRK